MLLLDSNIIIASHDPTDRYAKNFMSSHDVCCSAISKVETLGYTQITGEHRVAFAALFALIEVLPVDESVIEFAIELRQRRRMSLGDALIAGTALSHGMSLVTRNRRDFIWIAELHVINPYPLPD